MREFVRFYPVMRQGFLFTVLSVCVTLLACFAGATAQNVPAGFDLTNYGVHIEPDKRLMVVLATLETAVAKNAAGVDEKVLNTPLSESSAAFRSQLLAENAGMPDDLRRRISAFVTQYKRQHLAASDADLIAPFISMAYALTPVPELADPIVTNDLPGSLLDVLDFAPLVREYYRRSTIASKLDEYVKGYQAQTDGVLRTSTREMVSDLLNYLHTRPSLSYIERNRVETKKDKSKTTLEKIEVREHERKFYVVPERLAAKGNINFLNIRDDYYVIVPPDTDLSISDARRAFIQFVVDPLVINNSKEIGPMRTWVKPILDERRKTETATTPDIFLTITRSLVAAIDIRQSEFLQTALATDQARQKIGRLKTDAEKRAVSAELDKFKGELRDESTLRLYEDYQKGAVLSLYFAEQLKGIEDSGFDIASSLREMIASFDPVKETARLTDTTEARRRATLAREERKKHPETRTAVAENPVTTRLLEIQKLIDAKDYTRASADLRALLATNPSEPRIYFNIGRVAGLTAVGVDDPDIQAQKLLEAKVAYSNVLTTATPTTDRALLSLTYVALARIYEFNNDPAYAIKLYNEAIKLDDVTGGGFREAMAAKQRLLKP